MATQVWLWLRLTDLQLDFKCFHYFIIIQLFLCQYITVFYCVKYHILCKYASPVRKLLTHVMETERTSVTICQTSNIIKKQKPAWKKPYPEGNQVKINEGVMDLTQ